MYSKLPHLVIGFHGCDQEAFDDIIKNQGKLRPSQNSYDWLGHGIYFWENNRERAWDFACDLKRRNKIKQVAVIGAVIDLGRCLNLTDSRFIQVVQHGYRILQKESEELEVKLPVNKPVGGSTDLLLRHLDCAVIETVHKYNRLKGYDSFDSVRGFFIEGNPLYENAGFYEKTHIQICVRNPNCIKGYFVPIEEDSDYVLP